MEIAIIILIFMIVAVIIMVALATTTWDKGSAYINKKRSLTKTNAVAVTIPKCATTNSGCQMECNGQHGNPPPYTCNQLCDYSKPFCGGFDPLGPSDLVKQYYRCNSNTNDCFRECPRQYYDDNYNCFTLESWGRGPNSICPPEIDCMIPHW